MGIDLPAWLSPTWRRRLPFLLPPVLAGAVLLGAWLFLPVAAAPLQVTTAQPAGMPPPQGLLVDVSGAVAHPGLYRVSRGQRVYAAIAAAGGLAVDADPGRLPNMAGSLRDGQQVRVPARGSGRGSAGSARVSLNVATAAQLAAVPGFTPELASAVIEYRTAYGGFQTTRELVTALGMSPAIYAQARSHVTT
jgi:competence protein ComEA